MSHLDAALALAAQGFYVFPIIAGQKRPPAITNWQDAAMRDPAVIRSWWGNNPNDNVGIFTGKFQDDAALLVVDVDVKGAKNGDAELLRLEFEGWELPDTYTQVTPTGGRHLVYRVLSPVRQGTNVLGDGLDVRSRGGYIVGAGSTIDSVPYTANAHPVVDAPEWLVARCGESKSVRDPIRHAPVAVDQARALDRAAFYLRSEAPMAIEGQGGDETTYKVAARVKDFGVEEPDAFLLMQGEWNPRCTPPWDDMELAVKVKNAYKYGAGQIGASSPEADFADVPVDDPEDGRENPVDALNNQYALVTTGGGAHILFETADPIDGRFKLDHLDVGAFKLKHAPEKLEVGKTMRSVAQIWLEWKGRRQYEGLVFMPEQSAPARYYNLWRGFACAPAERGVRHPAVDAFLDHALSNVCGGDRALFRWLIGFFAHLIQRPYEKPLVALVFRGAKGVGKNALIERVGYLLGGHFLVTSNRRYLVGNFNGHMENCLLFVLDEAFWSGDKQAEGTLKDVITGREHVIEHKGQEPYTVANKTRTVIIGNEDWLVPATHDERRFVVFNVGEGRKQDRKFFQSMREGMEAGGYPVLLRFLMDFPLDGIDVNEAPRTQALSEQIHHTLDPLLQWWGDCLYEGQFLGADFPDWAGDVECERFRAAFRRYVRERNIRSRIPDDRSIGRLLKQCAPSIHRKRRAKQADDSQPWVYLIPPLDEARAEWDKFIGHATEWPQ